MKAETVVFLGAGASRALGLPLTDDILPGILRGLDRKTLFGDDFASRASLQRCLTALLPGLKLDVAPVAGGSTKLLPPITDVISTIDHLLQTSNSPVPDLVLPDLLRGRTLLERAIFEQLVRQVSPESLRLEGVPTSLLHEWGATARQLFQPRTDKDKVQLDLAVNWIKRLADQGRVTVISTNYDIEVEEGLYSTLGYNVLKSVDFGTSVRDPDSGDIYERPNDASLGIYKLHGSLNWLRCDVCDTIYVNPMGRSRICRFCWIRSRMRRNRPIACGERSGAAAQINATADIVRCDMSSSRRRSSATCATSSSLRSGATHSPRCAARTPGSLSATRCRPRTSRSARFCCERVSAAIRIRRPRSSSCKRKSGNPS